MKDTIFKKPYEKQFEFDKSVASVFDDMISRSIPFYSINIELEVQILSKILKKNANVIDFGCSTGTTVLKLYEKRQDLTLTGIDSSEAMIENAINKSKAIAGNKNNIKFICEDILKYNINSVDAVIMNYTLQFIRPIQRLELVKKIYDSLNLGGVFLFSEKLIFDDKKFSKIMIEIYEDFKKNQGYSKYEIAQKRQALENVLIPYTEKENKILCKKSGFENIECIQKWGNFATFIAIK